MGARSVFQLKNGHKNSNILHQPNHSKSNHAKSLYDDSIPAGSKNIEPKNKYDLTDSRSLHKMMSWGSHDPQASSIYGTEQGSKCSMRTPLAHNNVSLVHTHSPLPVPYYKTKLNYETNDPPLPSNGKSSPESVTPTGNLTPPNNPPKPVPSTPIEPDSDPSSLDYSLLDSSDSSDSGYLKQGQRTCKKCWRKGVTTNPIKMHH